MKTNKKLLHLLICKRAFHLFLILCFLLAGGSLKNAEAQTSKTKDINEEKALIKMSDEELVKTLASDKRTSFEAAKEIMRRGDKMMPLLVANKGNKQPYAEGSLGNPNSGDITFLPGDDKDWEEDRIITVEVASLYLISALYFQNFEFGRSAYIKDDEEVEFNKYNTDERVDKAWRYTENWLERMKLEGVSSLREKKISPLDESGFYF